MAFPWVSTPRMGRSSCVLEGQKIAKTREFSSLEALRNYWPISISPTVPSARFPRELPKRLLSWTSVRSETVSRLCMEGASSHLTPHARERERDETGSTNSGRRKKIVFTSVGVCGDPEKSPNFSDFPPIMCCFWFVETLFEVLIVGSLSIIEWTKRVFIAFSAGYDIFWFMSFKGVLFRLREQTYLPTYILDHPTALPINLVNQAGVWFFVTVRCLSQHMYHDQSRLFVCDLELPIFQKAVSTSLDIAGQTSFKVTSYNILATNAGITHVF